MALFANGKYWGFISTSDDTIAYIQVQLTLLSQNTKVWNTGETGDMYNTTFKYWNLGQRSVYQAFANGTCFHNKNTGLIWFVFQALYVEDGDDDDGDESQPPATAQEYLRRVMKEAKQVDFVGIGNSWKNK